jgi:predicted O-methyltransferase YrrM
MPLARTYDAARGKVCTSLHDGYRDRLSRWSDIQEYLPFLHETAKSYNKVRVLELGARRGNSTLAFLAGAAETGGHVTSVDIDDIEWAVNGMLPWRKTPLWTFIHGDDMDPSVQARLPGSVDVLFIDSSHNYDHTLAELRAYMPRVTPGGVALFHDTHLLGYQCPKDDYPAVRLALDDYCGETGLSWEDIPGKYGLGKIRL